ncbi:MAG: Mur ligase family protein [Patescibacteria group bacterium]
MKIFAKNLLASLARAVIKKYRPLIIGITGSVGKTSTKEAIFAVLASKMSVRKSPGNYNTEFGVSATILGISAPGRSPFRWLGAIARALGLLMIRDATYPKVLALEMAADRPGDIEFLVRIAPPKIGVLTAIGPAHLERFGTIERVAAEKSLLVAALPADGTAILNADDERVMATAAKTKARVVTYGFSDDAAVRAADISTTLTHNEDGQIGAGMTAKVASDGAVVPMRLDGVLGTSHVYAALAATSVGVAFGMNLVEIAEALHAYAPPPGRMRVISGIKYTIILDDTYNASPLSMRAALETLRSLPIAEETRRIAVLGDMLELGAETDNAHEEVGRHVAELGIDLLVAVGERARAIHEAASQAGMSSDRVFHFGSAEEAGRFVQERLRRGDIVLAKGSRGMRMERVVKELMAEPLRAKELLVSDIE